MTPDELFAWSTYLVLSGWALLLLFPGWRWSTRFITVFMIPLLLSALYMSLIVTYMSETDGNFESLGGVSRLFENPHMLVAGWVHYLAFDLFVGVWEIQDSRRLGILHWYVAPCLMFTFLFGPIGFIMYLVIRYMMKGAVFIDFMDVDDSDDDT